jgi:hypothetical protein
VFEKKQLKKGLFTSSVEFLMRLAASVQEKARETTIQ